MKSFLFRQKNLLDYLSFYKLFDTSFILKTDFLSSFFFALTLQIDSLAEEFFRRKNLQFHIFVVKSKASFFLTLSFESE